jgi:flagellar biosynthetic protein FliR
MIFAPFFGNQSVPARIKIGLTVVLVALLYPLYAPQKVPVGIGNWLSVMSGEVVLGLLMGLALNFVFEGVQLAGQILGFQFGYSLANVIDPSSQVDTQVLSVFHQIVALLIFLQFNAHHWILRGLASSFQYMPPGTAYASVAATDQLLKLGGQLWIIGIQMAAPVLLATMVADVVLGFMGKESPQLPVLLVGLSVKSVMGVGVLAAAVAFWPRFLEKYFLTAIQSTERVLHLAR